MFIVKRVFISPIVWLSRYGLQLFTYFCILWCVVAALANAEISVHTHTEENKRKKTTADGVTSVPVQHNFRASRLSRFRFGVLCYMICTIKKKLAKRFSHILNSGARGGK